MCSTEEQTEDRRGEEFFPQVLIRELGLREGAQ